MKCFDVKFYVVDEDVIGTLLMLRKTWELIIFLIIIIIKNRTHEYAYGIRRYNQLICMSLINNKDRWIVKYFYIWDGAKYKNYFPKSTATCHSANYNI